MGRNETVTAFKILYALAWLFFASYYFSWGAKETTVTNPMDESGWEPDGALGKIILSRAPDSDAA